MGGNGEIEAGAETGGVSCLRDGLCSAVRGGDERRFGSRSDGAFLGGSEVQQPRESE